MKKTLIGIALMVLSASIGHAQYSDINESESDVGAMVVCRPSRDITGAGFKHLGSTYRIHYVGLNGANQLIVQGRSSATGSIETDTINLTGFTGASGSWGLNNGYGYITEITISGLTLTIKGYSGATSSSLALKTTSITFAGAVSFAFGSIFANNINYFAPYPSTYSAPGLTFGGNSTGGGTSTANATLTCN